MLSGDMARSQIADRVREAEMARTGRIVRGTKRSSSRRARGSVLAVLLWPFRH
jgi:hypothetical protein